MTAREAYQIALKKQKLLPELEPTIMQDARHAYRYARYVIKGRWPEAEPYIMQYAHYAYGYAKYVIKDRWLEAEEKIANSKYRHNYIKAFFDEPVVTKDEVDIIQWERQQQVGYFAPASLFQNKVSLLDMVIEWQQEKHMKEHSKRKNACQN